ncbi:MAG: hypothetical protein IT289_12940 [Oligoflexia bacterium]|nr:hypothetical protein [Oligoflexia bacterium]
MTHWGIFLPYLTLLSGFLTVICIDLWGEESDVRAKSFVTLASLAVCAIQTGLLYRVPPLIYMRGSFVLDPLSLYFSMLLLVTILFLQLMRHLEAKSQSSHGDLLVLSLAVFGLAVAQSNRYFLGTVAIVGLTWSVLGLRMIEGTEGGGAKQLHWSMNKSMVLLTLGTFLAALTLSFWNESQLVELARIVVRPLGKPGLETTIAVLVIGIGLMVMMWPAFQQTMSRESARGSWPINLCTQLVLGLASCAIFVRWGIQIFTKVAVGSQEIENVFSPGFLMDTKYVLAVVLTLLPILALGASRVQQGAVFLFINGMAQALFSMTFGNREVISYAMGQLGATVLSAMALILAMESMALSGSSQWVDLKGRGQVFRAPMVAAILSFVSVAGLAPFYNHRVLIKTLRINSPWTLVLIFNLLVVGLFVARVTVLAFQNEKSVPRQSLQLKSTWPELLPYGILIFLGIFWDCLYKYGSFSIRTLFGDL